ncbi:30S ribosome-binding factor RbfA [Agaribacterium haliotis]|uniref:30S ribosome-binding factor RbfA n=1 Tax=Agaribacterium haliotis TaxID=2013869 RepID=UPI000BB59902|nr:30S ribosome-binding factor RbfA [Agaribacterium haliotis]
MPREFKRADRVSDALQRSIAEILRAELRDPRIGMPNINAVKVPNDLTSAKVYTTFIGLYEQKDIDAAIDVLNEAAPYIRTQVAKDVKMRVVPRIFFVYDKVAVEGQILSHKIDQAIAADKRNDDESNEANGNSAEGSNN